MDCNKGMCVTKLHHPFLHIASYQAMLSSNFIFCSQRNNVQCQLSSFFSLFSLFYDLMPWKRIFFYTQLFCKKIIAWYQKSKRQIEWVPYMAHKRCCCHDRRTVRVSTGVIYLSVLWLKQNQTQKWRSQNNQTCYKHFIQNEESRCRSCLTFLVLHKKVKSKTAPFFPLFFFEWASASFASCAALVEPR